MVLPSHNSKDWHGALTRMRAKKKTKNVDPERLAKRAQAAKLREEAKQAALLRAAQEKDGAASTHMVVPIADVGRRCTTAAEKNCMEEDLEKLKVPELRARLKAAGLPMSGTKAALLARLRGSEKQLAESSELAETGLAEDNLEQLTVPSPADRHQEDEVMHVLIAMSGLQGSGKSTLCKLLGRIYTGSIWLNQDEIQERGGARKTFLNGLRKSMDATAVPSGLPRLVLVDKMNHMHQHRCDVLEQAEQVRWRERGGRLLLVEMIPSQGRWPVDYLEKRIRGRGAAHRTLLPSESLSKILSDTAANAEQVSESERGRFDANVHVDVAHEVVDKALHVAAELYRLGWINALEWRQHALQGLDTSDSHARDANTLDTPSWVRHLAVGQKSKQTQGEGWDTLRQILQAEWEQLLIEEEEWRKAEAVPSQGGREQGKETDDFNSADLQDLQKLSKDLQELDVDFPGAGKR